MCETYINWSCSKVDILLRRTDTFGHVCFIYAFLSRISKAETVKRTPLQTNNFCLHIKNSPALYQHKKKFQEFPRNRELNRIFLSNFSKRNAFLHFKTLIFFLISYFSLTATLLSRTLYLCFYAALYNQPTVALRH